MAVIKTYNLENSTLIRVHNDNISDKGYNKLEDALPYFRDILLKNRQFDKI